MAKHSPFLSTADSARLDSWMVDIAADELGGVTESVFEDDHVPAERTLTSEYRLAIIMPIRGTLTHRIGPPLAERLA